MRNLASALAVTVMVVLAGCAASADKAVEPADDVEPTGRTIRLKVHVEDLFNTTVYPAADGSPGLKANMWGFCVEPADPNDAVSAAAIEYWTPLPGDAPQLKAKAPSLYGKCSVPAPTIRVQQGDALEVTLTNAHPHPHTLHWHGQYVPGTDCGDQGCADGAPGVSQKAVEGGESFTYKFIAKKAGTLWYHCHVDTQFHVQQGLYGMFIVEPKDQSKEPKVDAEYKMVLGTLNRGVTEAVPGVNPHNHAQGCFTSGRPNCQNPAFDLEPDVFMINGHSYPLTMEQPETLIKVKEGGATRIRILNAGSTFETLHPHGQDMYVTHRDGNPLASPYWVDTLTIGPAERYDVVIYGTNPGAWMIHTHVATHETNDGQSPGGMHTMLVYEGYEDRMHGFDAEIPGGNAYSDPLVLPSDMRTSSAYDLGTTVESPIALPVATATNVQFAFPVELACGAKTLAVDAILTGSAVTGTGTQLTLTVTDAAGNRAFTGRLGRNPDAPTESPTLEAHFLGIQKLANGGQLIFPQGNYTVAVTGSALDATLSLSATVDYYGTFDEQRLAAVKDPTKPVCGKYGFGTNDLDYQGPSK